MLVCIEKIGGTQMMNIIKFILLIIVIFLLRLIVVILKNIIYNIKSEKNSLQKAEEQITKNENKWINNLKNGKKVNFGNAIIQCKNNILKINEKSFSIYEIKKIELTSKTINVCEYENMPWSHDPINQKRLHRMISLNQYYDIRKSVAENYLDGNYPSSGIVYTYEFHNKYYLLITLNSGNQEYCFIGENMDGFEKLPIDYIERKMVLDLENYINDLKFKT